jgi:hypothetical protein
MPGRFQILHSVPHQFDQNIPREILGSQFVVILNDW